MKRLKVQFIVNHIDPAGYEHSILIYGKGKVTYGNMGFESVSEAKKFINEGGRMSDEERSRRTLASLEIISRARRV